MNNLKIGIFGATGEVGKELINVLEKLNLPVSELKLYANKSAGTKVETPFGELEVLKSDTADYSKLDLAFWAVSGEWSKIEWEKAKGSGCYIVDNSSAFRKDSDIPLIVSEVNGDTLINSPSKLISNPNCTTAIAAIPLHVLNQICGIKKISFTTYQSASGAGNGGIEELKEQIESSLKFEKIETKKFSHQLAFNVIPSIDSPLPNGYTKEEMKTDFETRKILNLNQDVKISSTCVRVPVERSHAEDILVETVKFVDIEKYKTILGKTSGVKIVDKLEDGIYPMPINSSKGFDVEVGRIRQPELFDNGIRFFVSGDQLLRGAALNAGLIAKKLYDFGKLN